MEYSKVWLYLAKRHRSKLRTLIRSVISSIDRLNFSIGRLEDVNNIYFKNISSVSVRGGEWERGLGLTYSIFTFGFRNNLN